MARAARAAVQRPPETSTWWSGSRTTRTTESWEAALGASVSVDTPGGAATVKVPAGSSSHRRLRLKGRGLPNRRGTPGNFYAELQIRVPTTLTDDERRLFEELAKVSSYEARSRR